MRAFAAHVPAAFFAISTYRFWHDTRATGNGKEASLGHKVAPRGAITAMVGNAVLLKNGAEWTDGKKQPHWERSEEESKSRGDWQAQEGWKESSS